MYILRLLRLEDIDKPLASLPVAFTGNVTEIREFSKLNNLRLVKDTSLFGFYLADKEGDCYLVDLA